MKIYLVSAMGHEQTGYGDGLIEGRYPLLLVSFLEFMNKPGTPLLGFEFSGKGATHNQPPTQPRVTLEPE